MLKKICLVMGLLLISFLGLAQLPEIGARFWPERFWEAQLRLVRQEYHAAELTHQRALKSLQALNAADKTDFPPGYAGGQPAKGEMDPARQSLLVTIQRSVDDQTELAELIQRLENLKAAD
jgi:hypothetical protein